MSQLAFYAKSDTQATTVKGVSIRCVAEDSVGTCHVNLWPLWTLYWLALPTQMIQHPVFITTGPPDLETH